MTIRKTITSLSYTVLPQSVLHVIKKIYYPMFLQTITDSAEPDLKIVRRLLQPGAFVIDIGANIGVYTKVLAEVVGEKGQVWSIEPVEVTHDLLASNIKRLHLKNVEVIKCAVSNFEGLVEMSVPDENHRKNYYRAKIMSTQAHLDNWGETVAAKPLDTMFATLVSPQQGCAFIKCDVEGHELAVVQGAQQTISRYKPAWLIEISGDPDHDGSAANQVFNLFAANNYKPYWFDGKILRRRNSGDSSVNYWFLSEEHVQRLHSTDMPTKL